jgi:hypothetical protein
LREADGGENEAKSDGKAEARSYAGDRAHRYKPTTRRDNPYLQRSLNPEGRIRHTGKRVLDGQGQRGKSRGGEGWRSLDLDPEQTCLRLGRNRKDPNRTAREESCVAFGGTAVGKPRVIWIQKLDEVEARALPNTEDASYPFWSPDGSQLGFFARGQLRKVEVASGTVQILFDAPSGRGGTWSTAGVVLFTPRTKSPLFRVPAGGGPVTPVTSTQGGESASTPELPAGWATIRL